MFNVIDRILPRTKSFSLTSAMSTTDELLSTQMRNASSQTNLDVNTLNNCPSLYSHEDSKPPATAKENTPS